MNMAFHGLVSEPKDALEDWASEIYLFGGTIDLLGNPFTNALWDEGYKYLKDQVTRKTSNFVYSLAENSKKTPVVILTPGIDVISNREYVLMSGVNSYSNKKEKKILLGHRSFGVKISFNSSSSYSPKPSGFTPRPFK